MASTVIAASVFLGFCRELDVDCACKVTKRTRPKEERLVVSNEDLQKGHFDASQQILKTKTQGFEVEGEHS
eukprot:6102529-Amphidinium_carterae.1